VSRLLLKFGSAILKDTLVGKEEVRIGRSSHCALVIDNPAVSHDHARVYHEAGQLMLEDFGSLNGTFVNGQRVKTVTLKPGDSVMIGKHTILVEGTSETADSMHLTNPLTPGKPKLDETVMLDTRQRSELVQRLAAAGESSQIAPKRLKLPTLVVRKGKTDRQEYTLSSKLTVIGKSAMATVRLTSWFAPKVAAQINRRENNSYYVGAAGKVPRVNGLPAEHPTELLPGDIIEIAGVRLEFQCRD
jgi:pSer/pThr/pTyr-binding forkhead associated (FHA) protein